MQSREFGIESVSAQHSSGEHPVARSKAFFVVFMEGSNELALLELVNVALSASFLTPCTAEQRTHSKFGAAMLALVPLGTF